MTWKAPCAAALLALCSLSFPAGHASAADKLEEWAKLLPKNSCVVISIKDTQELLKDWDGSGLGRFLKDEAVKRWMAPLYEDGEPAWDRSIKETSGSTLAENLEIYPGGSLASFIIDDNEDFGDSDSRFVSLSDIAGKETEIEAVKAKQLEAHRKGEHPDAIQITEEIEGVTVKAIAESDEEDAEWIEAWAVVDGVILEASDSDLMEEMLLRLKGGAGEENPAGARMARLAELRGAAADVSILVDLDQLVKMLQDRLVKEQGDNPATGGMPFAPVQIIQALGFDELHAAAFCLDITDEHSRGELVVLHDEKPQGILPALLRGTSTEVPRPNFVPEDVAAASVTRQSLGAIYDVLMKSINKLGPMAAMITMPIQGMEREVGMSLRNDLLGSLDDVYVEVQSFSPDTENPEAAVKQVTALKLKNRDRFGAAFDALLKKVGNGFGVFEESEFEGQKIFTMKSSLAGGGAPGAQKPTFSYTITDDYLLFSQGAPDLLHKILVRLKNPSGPALWDQAKAQAALGALPPGYTGMGVSDGSVVLRTVINMTTSAQSIVPPGNVGKPSKTPKSPKGPKAKSGNPPKPAATADPAAWFDPSAVPAGEVFERYFGIGATGMYAHPDATQILYISLPAEK